VNNMKYLIWKGQKNSIEPFAWFVLLESFRDSKIHSLVLIELFKVLYRTFSSKSVLSKKAIFHAPEMYIPLIN